MRWLLIITLIAACGGGGTRKVKGGRNVAAKREAIKPAAMKEFESGLRALRLGGPDANDTARVRLRAALKINSSIWEEMIDWLECPSACA